MEMGRSAPEVETAWMGYTAGSRCGDKVSHGALPAQAIGGGGIKEMREGSLDEGGVRAAVSPKEERREGGSGTGLDIHSGFSKHSLLPKANFS